MSESRTSTQPRQLPSPQPAQRRARGSVTLDQIVQAAFDLAQEGGLEAVTMPRVAQRVQSGVMTLYGHVKDKDQLLTLLCSRICADVDIDRTTGLGWESVLRRLSIALRDKMLEVPALAQLLIGRQMWSAEVASTGEWLFREMTEDGWTLRDAVRAFFAVQNYTLGSVLYEVGRTPGGSTAEHEQWWRHALADLPADGYPLTHAAAEFLPAAAREDQFLWGLDALIAGLRARHAASEPPHPPVEATKEA